MDRRGFLRGLGMVVAGVAIDQAIPLGRVWSFPSKIVHCTTRNFRIPMRFDTHCPPGRIDLLDSKLWTGLPYGYVPESSGTWMGIDRKLDPYNLRARLEEALADDNGFRITGITVPQND